MLHIFCYSTKTFPFQSSWCPRAPGSGIGDLVQMREVWFPPSLVGLVSWCHPRSKELVLPALCCVLSLSSDTSKRGGPFSPTAAVWSLLSHPSAWTVSLASDRQWQSCQGEQEGQLPIPNCAPGLAVEPSLHLPVDLVPSDPAWSPGTARLPSTSSLSPRIPWLPAVSISVGYMDVQVSKSETLCLSLGER